MLCRLSYEGSGRPGFIPRSRHATEVHAEDFGDFEESQLVESCSPKKKGDFR